MNVVLLFILFLPFFFAGLQYLHVPPSVHDLLLESDLSSFIIVLGLFCLLLWLFMRFVWSSWHSCKVFSVYAIATYDA